MKNALAQYGAIKIEISGCQRRAKKLQAEIDKLEVVSDTVRGTRKDGTIGPIKIKGYPRGIYEKKKTALNREKALYEEWEAKLRQKAVEAEAFVESLEDSDTRTIIRLYMELNDWRKVAQRMNQLFPRKRIPYTEDSCRKRYERIVKGEKDDGS